MENLKYRIINVGTPFLAVLGGLMIYSGFFPHRYYPTTEKVQPGYVIPSKLEIKVKDLDKNGQKETIIKYNGIDYLFKLDEQGIPIVKKYEIQPSKIVEKE